jgi:predicted permease
MIKELAAQQVVMLLLVLGGVIFFKAGLIPQKSVGSIINLLIYLLFPCNIVYAFLVSFDLDKLRNFAAVLIVAVFIQGLSILLGRVLYNRAAADKKSVLQFGTVNSNSILMGAPVTESLYGTLGMSYAAIYTIPAYIVMWSAGVAYFTKPPSKWTLVKSSATHPCMIAIALGLIFVFAGISLPGPVVTALGEFSKCVTPISMVVIGITLAEVRFGELADKTAFYFAVVRLGIIPLIAYGMCRVFHLDLEVTGVSVLLTAMPAGATTTIMAAKYNGNSAFASKCVVLTTILSFASTLFWGLVIGE